MRFINDRRIREQGATALIVVIFCVLLLATISVGFMRIVVQDQERTTNGELSRGAYDSALAGVEDGKRVLTLCQQGVAAACNAIDSKACTTISAAGLVSTTGGATDEVKLQTTQTSTGSYDQAYTCVKIDTAPGDYLGTLDGGGTQVIPLNTDGSISTASQVTLRWFKNTLAYTMPATGTNLPLLSSWLGTTPPILRVQLVTYDKAGYQLENFSGPAGSSNAGAHTLYMYPTKIAGSTTASFASDGRALHNGIGIIQQIKCPTAPLSVYLCSVQMSLPKPVTAATSTTGNTAYLVVTALYGATDFSVELPSGIHFSGVQAVIDSTGRAADVFRRVSARVERTNPNEASLYPRATVDITDNFCKQFYVTDATGGYNSSCIPSGP